jgi:hypothetical protein
VSYEACSQVQLVFSRSCDRAAKQANSLIGRGDEITPVPLPNGTVPDVEFPSELDVLLVGGSETRVDRASG